MLDDGEPYWRRKALGEMTAAEWESLCDGCAKCCLSKFEGVRGGPVEYTNIACRLLNVRTCRCSRYATRSQHVPDCISLTAETIEKLTWLPSTCAYRLIAEGRDLPWWHHLISNDSDLVHHVGASVLGRVVEESDAGPPEHHLVSWPA